MIAGYSNHTCTLFFLFTLCIVLCIAISWCWDTSDWGIHWWITKSVCCHSYMYMYMTTWLHDYMYTMIMKYIDSPRIISTCTCMYITLMLLTFFLLYLPPSLSPSLYLSLSLPLSISLYLPPSLPPSLSPLLYLPLSL